MPARLVQCPGCRGEFADIDGPTHRYMESSPGCWAAYGEVLAREYENPALLEVHRLTVDAYAAQHPGKPSRVTAQSVGLHLVRLLMLLEHGLPAAKANDTMRALAQQKETLAWLEPPPSMGAVTIASVVPRVLPEEHKAAVRAWASSVLAAWSAHRPALEKWMALADVRK